MKTVVIALLMLLLSLAATASPLEIEATVSPAAALPGIPVRLLLTVANRSGVAQTLPAKMVLEVRSDRDVVFIPSGATEIVVDGWPDEYLSSRQIAPGERRSFELPLGQYVTDGKMADRRMWSPGTYRLRLFFHDQLRNSAVLRYGTDGLLAAGAIKTPLLASSETQLRVEAPSGADAAIWRALLAKSDGHGLGFREDIADAVANELWVRAAGSVYRPYLIGYMSNTPRETLRERWNEIVSRDPDHPIAEQIRLGLAQTQAQEALQILHDGGDLQDVLSKHEKARRELKVLVKHGRHDLLRRQAAKALAGLKTAERLMAMHRDIAATRR